MKSALLKKEKKEREKPLSYFSLEPKILFLFCSRHNSMNELFRTPFKYENKRDMG